MSMPANDPENPKNTAEASHPPTSLATRAGAISGKVRPLAIALCLLVIFAVAARGRFALPPEPVMDPDSFGYLNATVTWLLGDGFWQGDGRAHLYPFFLWAIVSSTRGFSAITIFQHVAGLLSGAAWCWAWWLWASFLPPGIVRRWVAPALGLTALAIYLWGTRTILFEHMIRPEAVCPFVGLLQIAFCLAFAKARWRGGSRMAIIAYAAGAIFAGGIALNLKPSWGFAGLVPPALVAVALWRSTATLRLCSVLGVCLGLLALSGPLFLLPGLAGWKKDQASRTFLPGTLASVHAAMIARSLEGRARRGLLDPDEARFAEDFSRTVQEATVHNKSYPVLGVDCDNIFYRSGLFGRLPHGANASPETVRSYLLGLYFQALRDQPRAFAEKWGRELLFAYRLAPKELFRPKLRVRLFYQETAKIGRAEIGQRMSAVWKARWEAYWGRCRELAATAPEDAAITCRMTPGLIKFAAAALLPAFLFLPIFAVLVFLRRGRLAALRPAAAASLVVAAVSLAATVTVAIVHSFDLDRYLNLLVPLDVFLVASALSLLAAALLPPDFEIGRGDRPLRQGTP